MANLQDYVRWRGDIAFAERGFNVVDNLVLAALAYLDLGGVVPGVADGGSVSMEEAAGRLEELAAGADLRRLSQVPLSLLGDLGSSRRFGPARLSRYVDRIDVGEGVQFSALTVSLEDGSTYVAYRGTDMTIVGWREDFVMSFDLIPAQALAADYLRQVIATTDGPVLVGGHSKGGNLALYAAAQAGDGGAERIETVFSNDGPGLGPEAAAAACTERIAERVLRIAPTFSVVGMLFGTQPPGQIVVSNTRGLLQHDIMTWQVEGVGLVEADALDPLAVEINSAVAGYLEGADSEERRHVTEAVFDSLAAGGAVLIQDVASSTSGGVERVLLALLRSRGRLRSPVRHGARSIWRAVSSVDYGHLLRQPRAVRFALIGIVGTFLIAAPVLGVQVLTVIATVGLSALIVWRLVRLALRLRNEQTLRLPHVLIAAAALLLIVFALTRLQAWLLPANLFIGASFVLGAWGSTQAGLDALRHSPQRLRRAVVLFVNAGVAVLFGVVALLNAQVVLPFFVRQAGQYLLVMALGGLGLSVWDGAMGARDVVAASRSRDAQRPVSAG